MAVIFHKSNVPDMAKVYCTFPQALQGAVACLQRITSQFDGEQAIADLALPESLLKDYSQLFDFTDITAPPGLHCQLTFPSCCLPFRKFCKDYNQTKHNAASSGFHDVDDYPRFCGDSAALMAIR